MQDAFDKNKAQKVRRAAGLALMYLFMTVLAVVLLFPYMFMLLRSLMPVSYTHLDVYKRQQCARVPFMVRKIG